MVLKNTLDGQAVQKRTDARRAKFKKRGVYQKYVERWDLQRNAAGAFFNSLLNKTVGVVGEQHPLMHGGAG